MIAEFVVAPLAIATLGAPFVGSSHPLDKGWSAAPELGKKSNPKATWPRVASIALPSAARIPFHLVSPNPAGVLAMLDDLSTTSSTFTFVGLASRFVPPQVSVPVPSAPPSVPTTMPSMPAPEPLAPAPALDWPPLLLGPLSTMDPSFEPQAIAHSMQLSVVNAVSAGIRMRSTRREAADPAVARDTVAAVGRLLALLPVLTTHTHSARPSTCGCSAVARAAIARAAIARAAIACATAARATAAATTGGVSTRADNRTRRQDAQSTGAAIAVDGARTARRRARGAAS